MQGIKLVCNGHVSWLGGQIQQTGGASMSISPEGTFSVLASTLPLSMLTNGGARATGERIENYGIVDFSASDKDASTRRKYTTDINFGVDLLNRGR
jgi:hypothetical protein